MVRWKLVSCAAIVACTGGAALAIASPGPRWHRIQGDTKAAAERNVLRALPTRARDARIRTLINKKTSLVKNNVQVVCRGRGAHVGARYERFACRLRSSPRSRRRLIIVSYSAAAAGRFHIRPHGIPREMTPGSRR